ncbi:uridine phosphorylase domain protein, partial [Vibrio parahaemolyticus V-223/04]
IRPNNVI